MNGKLNPWLDVCRASAILLVLLSHGRVYLIPSIPDAQLLKFGGFLGVELFFVLSGFLIGQIIINKVENHSSPFGWIPGFWFRRWMRTYPSYILFLIINLLLITAIRKDSFPDLLKFVTFTQSLISPHPSFFGEAWSLTVEEVFYFITPLVISLFLFLTKNKNNSLFLAIAIMLLIPFLLRVNAAFNTNMTFNEIRATALFRVDSIMIGVVFSWAHLKNKIPSQVKFGTLLIPMALLNKSDLDKRTP